MPATIPADIWIRVAQFIPKRELVFMYGINSTFFQLSMDARYDSIWLSTFDDETVKYMPIYRQPAIVHRVHFLSVDLGSGDNKARRKRKGVTWTHETPVGEVIQAITDTVACFSNVTTFSIEWEHKPAEEHLLSFLSTAWKTFGSGVQNITFKVAFKDLPTLISTAGSSLVELSDLDVVILDPAAGDPSNEADGVAIADTLAEFVNKAAPNLRILSLLSYVFESELSPVFCRLGNIPNLERFSIYLRDLDKPTTVLHPLSLYRFLRDHAGTVRHLLWNSTSPLFHLEAQAKGKGEDAKEQLVVDWLRETKLEDVFSNLLTLRLPVSDLTLILPCIRLSVNTLTSLKLGHYFLSYAEVNTLACILAARQSGHLQELIIKVFWFSPEVMVLLAQTLPSLEQLGIKCLFMTTGGRERHPRDKEAELALAREFADALRRFDFRQWSLRDFTLKRHQYYDPELNIKLMMLVAECVPSVQTLVGGLPKDPVAHITL